MAPSQWVTDVKSFAPTPVPILPYVIITLILMSACTSVGLANFKPPADGIEVTNTTTGEKSKDKVIGWVLFFVCIVIIPIIIGSSLFQLHFMINNPGITATAVGTSMISNAIRGR